jgi:rhamnosyltransferase
MGIVYGPYRPRPDAAEPVRIELERWFRSLSPDGGPQVERMAEGERSRPVRELVGRRGFFTDANACLARNAWERVPFRDVRYAEDRVLAIDMLRAGYAKAFLPSAAVIHSHDYGTSERLRRSFDEARGLLEIYGWREPASPARLLSHLRGELAAAHLDLVRQGIQPPRRWAELVAVARHHAVARTGALLGSRADRLPESVRGWLSLEGRSGFTPLELDVAASPATHDNPPR